MNMLKLVHPSVTDFHDRLVNLLCDHLQPILLTAQPGHCLRITTLSDQVADQLCQRLMQNNSNLEVAVLRQKPDKAWHSTPSRLIELRNQKTWPLLVFVPPGESVPDSLEISTFNEISLANIPKQFREKVEESAGKWAVYVREMFESKRIHLPEEKLSRYALSVAINGGSAEAAGGAIYQLGLIPDFQLLSDSEKTLSRLERNLRVVDILADPSTTLLARIQTLDVRPNTIQEPLYKFLKEFRLRPEKPEEWGREIASSEDSAVRKLAFEFWEHDERPEPLRPKIYIHELKLAKRKEDDIKVLEMKTGNLLPVKWELDKKPIEYPDLTYFRIEIVSTEGGTLYESPNIKPGVRAVRSSTLKNLNELNISDDLCFIRVRGYDQFGNLINIESVRNETDALQRKINESENIWFYASDEEPPEVDAPRNQVVRSFLEAKLSAQFRALDKQTDPFKVKPREATWLDNKKSSRKIEAMFGIQYDIQSKFTLPISNILRRLEDSTLEHPEMLGRWNLDFRGTIDNRQVEPTPRNAFAAPREFLDIRTRLFNLLHEEDGISHLTATRDLSNLKDLIYQYAGSYLNWLNDLSKRLSETEGTILRELFSETAICLEIDTIELYAPFGIGEDIRAVLLSPTHPLRLLWHLQLALATQEWLYLALASKPSAKLSPEFREFMSRGVLPDNLPLLLLRPDRHVYVDAGALSPFWQLYLPPDVSDSRAVRARVEKILGLNRNFQQAPIVTDLDLTRKIQRYLVQHPYVTTLKINVFNPGDAKVLCDVIETLEKTNQGISYQIRLFADQARVEDIGEALDELTNPERQVGSALDPFTIASQNPLFPKLKYSRGRLEDFLRQPMEFDAHLSILFDSFKVRFNNAQLPEFGRSNYLYGLIQEPVTRFEGANGQYVWRRQFAPASSSELTQYPGGASLITRLLAVIGTLQSAVAAAKYARDVAPALQLDLHPDDKELLHQIHTVSDWVLIIDRNLGFEYFDSTDVGERPVYLLDFTPEFDVHGSERLLLTTRSTKEITRIIQPALSALGLENLLGLEKLILEMLRSLSGRLALKLISSPAQAEEAVGLALARLFLEQYELLHDRIVVPLDAHTNLFSSAKAMAELGLEDVSLRRGDLLLLSFKPEERLISFCLVEVKCRQDLGSLGNYVALKESIREQLESTRNTLSIHFDPGLTTPDRLDRVVKSRELAELVGFYLERAIRYGSMSSDAAQNFAAFLGSLDAGYVVRFQQIGLVFDFGVEGVSSDEDSPGVSCHRVGIDYARRIVENGLQIHSSILSFTPALVNEQLKQEGKTTTMINDKSFAQIQKSFGSKIKVSNNIVEAKLHDDKFSARPISEDPELAHVSEIRSDGLQSSSLPVCEVLLAENGPTPQYGILGEVGGKKVGLDLNGCNTISVFGVQGGGKSYTIGAIAEMAIQPIRGINALASPLASVIFHYHESQDYPPEFVSMINPNDKPAEIEQLKSIYGAAPVGLNNVLLLTSADKLADRKREFPSITVEPIYFNSSELGIKDWLFLMGAVGNSSIYVQQMNVIMRRLRNNLTLAGLRDGIEHSNLSDSQKGLAFNRLSFAEEFIRDDQNLREKIQPGRLIIVDYRDELIQKEQALGLFVVILNVFSGAGQGSAPFNKLIVFDEAHKYITNSDLTSHVVETIREMRHKGVSIVLASQDPPSLPGAVIELSSVVILHKFNSPKWLNHIQKSVTALATLTAEKMGALRPGEAFVWASKATDRSFTQMPVKVLLRPRITLHGGGTKKAVR